MASTPEHPAPRLLRQAGRFFIPRKKVVMTGINQHDQAVITLSTRAARMGLRLPRTTNIYDGDNEVRMGFRTLADFNGWASMLAVESFTIQDACNRCLVTHRFIAEENGIAVVGEISVRQFELVKS